MNPPQNKTFMAKLKRGLFMTHTEIIEKMKEAGITLVTDVDKKAFQASVKPVWDKYGAKYGELLKRIDAVS